MLEKTLPFIVPGLIYGIGTIGLALIFRFLKFPDFTTLGSIMLGGVASIWVANQSTCMIGIIAAPLFGVLLGAITSLLKCRLQVSPVLAGIITYTGSFTLGYIMTKGGTVALKTTLVPPFSSVYERSDVLKVSIIALIICIVFAFLIRTKIGSMMLAMTADPHFVRCRHRYRNLTTMLIIMLGNGIVSFAGGLYAMRDRTAQVQSHMDFLPFALGAIFGGNALASWLARKVQPAGNGAGSVREHGVIKAGLISSLISSSVSVERGDSHRLGFLLVVYVLGCLFFKEISGLVNSNAFKEIHPILSVNADYQYLITAVIIVFCVWWYGCEDR